MRVTSPGAAPGRALRPVGGLPNDARGGALARAIRALRALLPGAMIAAAFAHALVVSWRRWGDLLVDCGRELSVPQRMLAGERLYADLQYYYGPLGPYLNMTLYRLLGVRVEVLAGAGIVAAALTCVALYRLTRAFVPAFGAALVACSFVYLCAFGHLLRTLHIFDFVIPYSYAAIYGVAAATWSVVWLVLYLREGRRGALALSVAALAAVALTKMELLAAAAAAHGIALLTASGARERRRLAVAYVLGMVPVAAAYALLWWRVGSALFSHNLFSQLNPNIRVFNRVVLGLFDDPVRNLSASAAVLSGAVVAAWALARSPVARRPAAATATFALLAIAIAAVYLRALEVKNAFRFLPVAAAVALAALAARWWRDPERRQETRAHLVLWTFTALVILRIAFLVGPQGYGFYLLPPALPAVGVLLFAYVPAVVGAGAPGRLVASAVGTGLLLGASTSAWSASSAAYALQDVPVETGRGRLLMDRDSLQPRLVKLLSGLPPSTRVLTVPIGIGLTFMAGLDPVPDRMSSYFPVEFFPGNEEDDVLARWRRAPPDVVVWVRKPLPEYGSRGFGEDYGLRLREWILSEYEERSAIDTRVVVLGRRRGTTAERVGAPARGR